FDPHDPLAVGRNLHAAGFLGEDDVVHGPGAIVLRWRGGLELLLRGVATGKRGGDSPCQKHQTTETQRQRFAGHGAPSINRESLPKIGSSSFKLKPLLWVANMRRHSAAIRLAARAVGTPRVW